MFNRVSKISTKTLTSDTSRSRGELDAGSLESSLADAEAVQYALASAAGIEHTTRDRTTTIEPGDDNAAYAVVSNRHVYFLVGENPTEPELTLDIASVSDVDLRNALLSSTLVFSTSEETVRFMPADTEAAEDLVSYVSRVGGAWSDLFDALEKAHRSLVTVESAIRDGEDPQNAIQRARSRLSNAHHCATHHDEAPTELMKAEIAPVEDKLDRLRFGSRLDRAEELVEDARAAQEAGAFGDGVAAVVEATEVIRNVASVVHDTDMPGVSERLTSHANDLDAVARGLLSEAERSCNRAMEAEDPGAAITAWQDAFDRYRETVAAGWDGPAGTSLEALRFQLAWVVGNLVGALTARADEREAAAAHLDVGDSDAVEHYEAALQDVARARDLAEEHPYLSAETYANRVGKLDVKIERAEWQWGTAD